MRRFWLVLGLVCRPLGPRARPPETEADAIGIGADGRFRAWHISALFHKQFGSILRNTGSHLFPDRLAAEDYRLFKRFEGERWRPGKCPWAALVAGEVSASGGSLLLVGETAVGFLNAHIVWSQGFGAADKE